MISSLIHFQNLIFISLGHIKPGTAVCLLFWLLKNIAYKGIHIIQKLLGILRVYHDWLTHHSQILLIILIQFLDFLNHRVKGIVIRTIDKRVLVEYIRNGRAAKVHRNGITVERIRNFLRNEPIMGRTLKAQGKFAFSLKICFAAVVPLDRSGIRHIIQIGAGRLHSFIFAELLEEIPPYAIL